MIRRVDGDYFQSWVGTIWTDASLGPSRGHPISRGNPYRPGSDRPANDPCP